ncbi:MAG: ABC transporter permease [Pseudomonadota bacterium]
MLEAFGLAFHLVVTFDPDLYEIIGLSLRVSLMALVLASVIGLPLGALVGFTRFPGRGLAIIIMNALMGMPPVVVGLLLYLMISRSGPFGGFALLYTPTAMILAQTLLILPIVAALTRQTIEDLHAEYDEQFRSLSVSRTHALTTLLADARYSLMTVLLAGFGRAIAEVGAVIIVGGNINHFTRVMTTAIALETSKGDLALAVALGMVLLALALAINAIASGVRAIALRNAYV